MIYLLICGVHNLPVLHVRLDARIFETTSDQSLGIYNSNIKEMLVTYK